jgi:hypothetical protein
LPTITLYYQEIYTFDIYRHTERAGEERERRDCLGNFEKRGQETDRNKTHKASSKPGVSRMTSVISNYSVAQHNFARPPPSPPMESHNKCTLPSISNLLGLADAGSPTNESSPTFSPRSEATSRRHSAFTSESRPGSGYGLKTTTYPYPPRGFPPSPPLGSDAPLDSRSPVNKTAPQFPPVSKPASSGYYHETTPPLESELQRQGHHHHHHSSHHTHAPPPPPHSSHGPLPPYPRQAPHPASQPASSYFPPTSATAPPPPPPAPVSAAGPPPSAVPHHHHHHHHHQQPPPPPGPGMAQQRALPQSFHPVNMPSQSPTSTSPSAAISWQHHHYLHPASGQLFPQSQDRYICQTCNKAFSRPSSLRIHSHSHTGEKPFKCSQAGCGKAFSVRSNMKRHERGCHSVEVKAGGPMMA